MNKKIYNLEKQIDSIRKQINSIKKNSFLICLKCGKRNKVKNLTLIQTFWYVRPYGCTGGDYWKPGEKQYVCPKCEFSNRLYKRKFAFAMQGLFSSDIDKINDEIEKALALSEFFGNSVESYD